jgi:uncharacterized protein (DUF2336 family)
LLLESNAKSLAKHASQSLIAELEDAFNKGSPEKRIEALRRITDLFVGDADHLDDAQIAVFDDVLCHLIQRIETKAMADLSLRLAALANAPREVIRKLARHDEILVAEPVLSQSPQLTDEDLIEIAGAKSQQHLFAIAGRSALPEVVTDVLVSRGHRQVHERLAGNRGARFSPSGFDSLLKSAEGNDVLAVQMALRIDLPMPLLRRLLSKATETVRERLLAVAPAEVLPSIQQSLSKIANELRHEIAAPRDFSAALKTVEAMRAKGTLNEAALSSFAKAAQYEETVAALAALCSTSVDLIAPIMRSVRNDGLLVACKAVGLRWSTVRTILLGRVAGHAITEPALEDAKEQYLQLSKATAERTLRFWKVRVAAS